MSAASFQHPPAAGELNGSARGCLGGVCSDNDTFLLCSVFQTLQEALPGAHAEARGGSVPAGRDAAGLPGTLPHGRGAAPLSE
jgi:hypothetical protein